MIVALQNLAGGGRRPDSAPPGARCAIDLVRPVEPRYSCVWQNVLRDALVFDSEDLLSQYKAQHGYGRTLAARREGGDWRVVRGVWEVRFKWQSCVCVGGNKSECPFQRRVAVNVKGVTECHTVTRPAACLARSLLFLFCRTVNGGAVLRFGRQAAKKQPCTPYPRWSRWRIGRNSGRQRGGSSSCLTRKGAPAPDPQHRIFSLFS